jgi:hypothetical protein
MTSGPHHGQEPGGRAFLPELWEQGEKIARRWGATAIGQTRSGARTNWIEWSPRRWRVLSRDSEAFGMRRR